jgi:tRNA threonylcarbamoyladenosine biosynthesis protein TsaE
MWRMSKQLPHAVQSQHVLDFISHSVAQTIRIGQRLGELMRRGDLVVLLGDFGTGKTHLIKGIAQGLGSADLVNSPSFVLINEYRAGPQHGGMPIYHADLYRIGDPAELAAIGIEEAWAGDGVCLIEWAEQAGDWLPLERLAIHFQHLSETKRVLRFVPHGARYEELLAEFKKTAIA